MRGVVQQAKAVLALAGEVVVALVGAGSPAFQAVGVGAGLVDITRRGIGASG